VSKLTPQQIVETLSTPLGRNYFIQDETVLAERKRIRAKYEELQSIPIWCPGRGPKGEHDGPGAMLTPGFEYASIEARAWWLQENVLGKVDEVEAELLRFRADVTGEMDEMKAELLHFRAVVYPSTRELLNKARRERDELAAKVEELEAELREAQ